MVLNIEMLHCSWKIFFNLAFLLNNCSVVCSFFFPAGQIVLASLLRMVIAFEMLSQIQESSCEPSPFGESSGEDRRQGVLARSL